MTKWGLNKIFFESLDNIFNNWSPWFSRRYFMYLYPKDDKLQKQMDYINEVLEKTENTLLIKMITKKQDILKNRIKAYK